MLCSTNSRVPALQIWPELANTAIAAPGTAISMSASANTMSGDLPPSSSDTRFRFPADARMIDWPVKCEPVNATLSTSGCDASAAPAVSPKPGTTLTTPAGPPAPRPQAQCAQAQGRQRCFLGWLQHDGAAGGQRWPDLPDRGRQWAVPRNDRADHADGFLQRERDDLTGQGIVDRFAVQ